MMVKIVRNEVEIDTVMSDTCSNFISADRDCTNNVSSLKQDQDGKGTLELQTEVKGHGDTGEEVKDQDDQDNLKGPVFVPRLYLQRYSFVKEMFTKHRVKSVVDLGSSECKICHYLADVPTVEKVALVDVDSATLESNKYVIRPFTYDYIKKRDNPLHIQIFDGSATELDEQIVGFEAVSMVEIIEHLYPDVLENVTKMVFRDLQPRIVVITTPNADFNVLFPSLTGFRHWDHKFEWTREEFQSWCQGLSEAHGYNVDFTGVGEPPQDYDHLGYCSQAAVFVRKSEQNIPKNVIVTHNYRLVAESYFPYNELPVKSESELLALEVEYHLHQYQIDAGFQTDDNVILVPLATLHKTVSRKHSVNLSQLKKYLLDHGYRLSAEQDFVELSPLESSSGEDNSCIDEFDTVQEIQTAGATCSYDGSCNESWD